jgi:hypothetical protein
VQNFGGEPLGKHFSWKVKKDMGGELDEICLKSCQMANFLINDGEALGSTMFCLTLN